MTTTVRKLTPTKKRPSRSQTKRAPANEQTVKSGGAGKPRARSRRVATAVAVQSPARGQHGGKRAGAGAKTGNLNAVKTGARSQTIMKAVRLLMATPITAAIFGALAAHVTGNNAAAKRHTERALRLLP
jgi:hypothetical protein